MNKKIRNSKKWQSTISILVTSAFVAASALISVPNLSNIAFGYGGAGGAGDINPPSISNIVVTEASDGAVVSWTTNESSISWIIYGLTTDYDLEKKTTSYSTSHSLILGELSSETTYHFQIKSKDSSGNVGSYTDLTFTTLAVGEEPVPPEEEGDETPVSEMTIAELSAEITRISALIAQLQAQLAGLEEGAPAVEGCTITSFDSNLKKGDTGDDVKCLQIILNSDSDTIVAESGVGSSGNETTYFGSLTEAAVIKFQEKYTEEILTPWDLTEGNGFVGSTTRTQLNTILAGL